MTNECATWFIQNHGNIILLAYSQRAPSFANYSLVMKKVMILKRDAWDTTHVRSKQIAAASSEECLRLSTFCGLASDDNFALSRIMGVMVNCRGLWASAAREPQSKSDPRTASRNSGG